MPDIATALAEARRVLRPGGRVAILDTDWDSLVWHSRDPERMRRVLAVWDEHLADPYLPRRLPHLLREAGLTLAEVVAHPILNAGYDPNTYSASVVSTVGAFVSGRSGIGEGEAAAWQEDLVGMGPDYFFCITRCLFVATR